MNNQLYLYYKEFNLGELKYVSNMYFWLPNNKMISNAKEKYPVGMKLFFLPEDKETFNKIPHHFEVFLTSAGREDLIKKANIATNDNEFTKLLKLSNLTFYNQDFVIKNK